MDTRSRDRDHGYTNLLIPLIAIAAAAIFGVAALLVMISVGGSLVRIAEALEAQNTHYEIGAKAPDDD